MDDIGGGEMGRGERDMRDEGVDLGIEGCDQAVEIGRGGFSIVYRAWQPAFGRHVAVKLLAARLDASEADRFARECEAIGGLQGHPNIVTVHTAGRRPDGQPFIIMEFLGAGSLADRIRSGPLSWSGALDVGVRLAGALESAHRAGVLHRDVKPANVMRTDYGDCKLGDFGIARVEGRHESRAGAVTATWSHAPPEVVDGRRPTPASDIYSLASTIFTLIDGRPPFVRTPDEALPSLLARIVREPVRESRVVIPDHVRHLLRQALSKDPATRPATAAEFGRQMQAAQAAAKVRVTTLPLAVEKASAGASVDPDDPTTHTVARHSAGTTPPPVDRALRTTRWRDRRWLALPAVAAVLGVSALIATNSGGGATTTTSTLTGATSSTAPASLPAGASTPPSSAGSPGPSEATSVRLGPDLASSSAEPCRNPVTTTGATWQQAAVQLGGTAFGFAYYCNLFAGGTGALDFILGSSYTSLTASIGFADGSTSTSHVVRFEFIGDGRLHLIEPKTVRFGEVQRLLIDVSGITRLQVRVTELSPAGGSEGASRPVIAAPTLSRA